MTTPILATSEPIAPADVPVVDFDTHPSAYRHWKLEIDGPTATLTLSVDPHGGLVSGYELKMNSYDLGVDIELYDAVQRLRFEHPEVRAVVITGGLDRMFCAGANIRMLAQSSHAWKVNFCKFTNETRNGIEDATEHSGQTYIAALNGTAAGGGYELAAACDQIVLIDDGSSAVSLPEVPLLGVLPGTGGLTRVVDKRKVRKDRADVFASRPEGLRGAAAVEWGLVDETVPRAKFDERVHARAEQAVAGSGRPGNATGIALTPLAREIGGDDIRYRFVHAALERGQRRADITVSIPQDGPPADVDTAVAQGVDYWPLALTRELDDLILRLRTNEPDIGTWVFRVVGNSDVVRRYDRQLQEGADDWFINEVRLYYKRTLKRLDVTSRSLFTVIEPGSAFVGFLLELALASDRQYMLDGVYQDIDPDAEPASIELTEANFGDYPMGNGLTRVESRFYGHSEQLTTSAGHIGQPLQAADADRLGLITAAYDDIDFADELRITLEERAALSPDALTGMEANHRFVGPETVETKIFGRLTAWQNWIFVRPNAAGPEGALRRYGTGERASFDIKRV
ncbi:short chain enoyl-CoA hydratase [Mycobacteroides abscessus subsp. bolletii]|uniref:2,3-epoxybenzoyl-CoA dihydrolase n=1 Tax=Mycobacteroides abscessus TaxID=36809 RepID=UPI0009A7224B|nr:2,3-epoxybenzoyl-CoA dihydrolase [Mycobacteroides abscessus]SKG71548.1 short chain enoyl-CoA hydratase [Mycobacteroides abscessus subsp. bolletii]SKH10909.1 short chain enoyl-CoA hydratase [Mycobacteroides abscessus subsp. bolletii]